MNWCSTRTVIRRLSHCQNPPVPTVDAMRCRLTVRWLYPRKRASRRSHRNVGAVPRRIARFRRSPACRRLRSRECTSGVKVARYYDPATAQFLTRDPLTSQTRSPYGYVGGDPLDATDPTGLNSCGVFSGLCTLASGANDVISTVGNAASSVGECLTSLGCVKDVSLAVQVGADGVAIFCGATGLEPCAGVALAVSSAAGAVNTIATCAQWMSGGDSSGKECAETAAVNAGTLGFGRLVAPARTLATGYEPAFIAGGNLFGDLFAWALGYDPKSELSSPGCAS